MKPEERPTERGALTLGLPSVRANRSANYATKILLRFIYLRVFLPRRRSLPPGDCYEGPISLGAVQIHQANPLSVTFSYSSIERNVSSPNYPSFRWQEL